MYEHLSHNPSENQTDQHTYKMIHLNRWTHSIDYTIETKQNKIKNATASLYICGKFALQLIEFTVQSAMHLFMTNKVLH